jgi:ribosomal protein L3 glutamine methyltransferase
MPARRLSRSSKPAPALESVAASALAPTGQLATLRAWLALAEKEYPRAGLALSQIADNAHDDALFLFLRALDWPLDSEESALDRKLNPAQRITLREALRRRVEKREPAAYIVGEAWLGGLRFQVDPRVIIPRSYFVELIPALPELLPYGGNQTKHVVDVCTGSGCLAILLARTFPGAAVDGIDLSPDALAVARENVAAHKLKKRVTLHQADVWTGVPAPRGGYEVILSNPPYEPSAHVDRQTAEFRAEPRLAHDGGSDGLVIIRSLLAGARERLARHGIVVIEVGPLRKLIDREYAAWKPEWLDTGDGSNCVVLFRADHMRGAPRL